ncbi:MAG: glutathione S-transferase, partial [Clostridiales bacterium]|nr:glutathione S-transferase [Clostridiales bacterium]
SQLYANADPKYNGRATVPALVDITTKAIVNNDYHRLTNYLEVQSKPFHKENAPDLYPEHLRKEIDKLNDEFLFHNVNNGTYRMMFAQSLIAYDEAYNDFFSALDNIEERLETNRFLFGDYVTDSDIRLFVTLVRFETRYYRFLGPIKKRITEYKNIWGYARDLYAIPAFKNNTYLKDIASTDGERKELFESYATRFANEVDYDGLWSTPQDRKNLSKTPDKFFF